MHDQGYKQLFAHAELVSDLLQGFVHEAWTEQIDYATLERVNGSYVTDDLREREDDIIWRVRLNDSWLYVYLLIEFQSGNDPWMALRVMVYTGLLYQDLIKTGAVATPAKLPPVFPIVIYNGAGRWRAARELADLIETLPPSLARYRPSQCYFLLDEGRVGEDELAGADNTFGELIRIESGPGPQDMRRIVERLGQRLQHPRHDSLRRAIVVWLNRVVFKHLLRGENIPEINNLEELKIMFGAGVIPWTERWKQEGQEQGQQQGGGDVLRRQLTRRFGPLPQWAEDRLTHAELQQLETWADKVLDAQTLEAVFDES